MGPPAVYIAGDGAGQSEPHNVTRGDPRDKGIASGSIFRSLSCSCSKSWQQQLYDASRRRYCGTWLTGPFIHSPKHDSVDLDVGRRHGDSRHLPRYLLPRALNQLQVALGVIQYESLEWDRNLVACSASYIPGTSVWLRLRSLLLMPHRMENRSSISSKPWAARPSGKALLILASRAIRLSLSEWCAWAMTILW